MRSRYAAFARGEVDYLVDTLHASKRSALERRELEASVKRLRWVGLRILDTARGGPADPDGVVEFEARYEAPGDAGVLHERSRFVREGDRWYYLDGEFPGAARGAKAPGRNEPCPCGSGKKFKRCCAAR
jgi:SEC-C motif-containing protein